MQWESYFLLSYHIIIFAQNYLHARPHYTRTLHTYITSVHYMRTLHTHILTGVPANRAWKSSTL